MEQDGSRDPVTLSAEYIKYWVIDRGERRRGVVFQSGEQAWEEIAPNDPLLQSQLDKTILDWEKWWVVNITKRGEWVTSEAFSPVGDPLKGRPVVYLDQNHWSALAVYMVEPSRLRRKAEADAAAELILLAMDGGVVLPLSSANLYETSALYGERRHEVGLAMAALSGG